MKCKNCGSEVDVNSKFCTICGQPIVKETPKGKKNNLDKKKIGIIVSLCIIAIIVIAVLAGVLTGASSTKEFKNALETGNAYTVNSLYSDSYDSSSKKEKYDKLIGTFLADAQNEINEQKFESEAQTNGHEVVVDYVQNKYGTLIISDDTPNMSQSVDVSNQEGWDNLMGLIQSKSDYCDGVYSYKTDNDFQSAINYFAQVSEADSFYEDSKNKIGECTDAYISSILKQVDEYIQNDDIGSGIDLLDTAKSWLDENGINSDEIQDKINEVLVSYAEKYATNAENAFKEHDVNAAIGNIEVAMELQPDNGDYKSKYDTYQQYLPFVLYLEENVLNEEEIGDVYGGVEYDSTIISNNNKTMLNTMRWYEGKEYDGSYLNVNYDFAGKYDTVTGTIFIDEYAKNDEGVSYFKAYGDGKLLYTSPKVTAGVLPQEISFNVSGVQKLTISFYSDDSSGCVSGLTAQKDFPE